MTTLTDFAPKAGWTFTFNKFAKMAPMITADEIMKNIKFFEDSVRKGVYGLCESLYRDNEIRSMGYAYRPDSWVAILVHPSGWDFVTRYLPGNFEDYTTAQIDKWVREFDGASEWCIKPAMRWVPSLKNEDMYDVNPDSRPTITNDTF